jgi:tetratricopeptide (TPR) repeat protein
MGKPTEAFADFDRAALIDPNDPRVFVLRGLARGRGGDAQGALADYNLALKVDYRNVDALVNRAAIYSMNGEQKRAIVDLDLALSLSARDPLAFYNRGYAHFALKEYGKAIQDYGSAIRLDPDMAIAYNNRCMTRVVANIDLPEAVKDCDAALKALPNRADFRDTRGFVFLKLGKPRLAFMEYDTAVKLDAKRPLSLYGRAIARLRMGDSAAAETDRASAIALDPTIEAQFGTYGVD